MPSICSESEQFRKLWSRGHLRNAMRCWPIFGFKMVDSAEGTGDEGRAKVFGRFRSIHQYAMDDFMTEASSRASP